METRNYEVFLGEHAPIKAWVRGVPVGESARRQLENVAALPFIHKWVAVMPDVHWGKGATIGSVIATVRAIVPAAVGVDLGCGMMALRTSLTAEDLPDSLAHVRAAIERAVPHGRSHGGRKSDRGAWSQPPPQVDAAWEGLRERFERVVERQPKIARSNHRVHLGTLGSGNHFVEVCLDEQERVWFMLHSGSRGVGNRIGSIYIELAKKEMERWHIRLPDGNLAYIVEGSQHFDAYVEAVAWAQDFARINRELMMARVVEAVAGCHGIRPFVSDGLVVNCHHNYVALEHHYGSNVWVTRKGAVRARRGDLGIIPGSMGTRSYIVSGKAHPESFHSCSHGAGRAMSRAEARRRFSIEEHSQATEGVECRKDAQVIDETPAAYKPIEAVMAAQSDLVDIVHTLRQVVCVKG